jgi:hypothetical protein
MSTVIRVIEPATPENIKVGDYLTLRRIRAKGPGVEVRGTVNGFNRIWGDYLTLTGWPNQRFHIDGENPAWTVTRIQREEELPDQGVPFIAGHATVHNPGEPGVRRPGVLLHGVFYVVHSSEGNYRPAHWTDFLACD